MKGSICVDDLSTNANQGVARSDGTHLNQGRDRDRVGGGLGDIGRHFSKVVEVPG